MELLKRRRAVIRRAFTRVANEVNALLVNVDSDRKEIEAKFDTLTQKQKSLTEVDEEIFSEFLNLEATTDDELDKKVIDCEEYAYTYAKLNVTYRDVDKRESASSGHHASEDTNINASSMNNTHKFKLPQIEFKKFGGDVREWLPFWSLFKKIDQDDNIAPSDKFQNLLLAITPKSRARELVESYPPTAENYPKVIESLQSRFGREDLLIEVYVRELLKLVLGNALSTQGRSGITTLYDKIETQLRALDTLGITTETCTAMLYPLVESCLPEELLRVWQRSTDFASKPEATSKDRLGRLMLFLKNEVEGEERIALAVEGFGLENLVNKPKKSNAGPRESSSPTAAGLLSSETVKCLFCEGNHISENCFKAKKKMTVEEKQRVLKEKNACFRCAKIGHRSRYCRQRVKCENCGGPHLVILCQDLVEKIEKPEINSRVKGKEGANQVKGSGSSESALANHTDMRVFLQTLRVKMRSETGEREVRAIIDTGSQRSYVRECTAQELKYSVKREDSVVHALFGGVQTSAQQHDCYDVRLASLEGNYACRFEAFSQPVICSDISHVYSGRWIRELRRRGITLTDTKGCQPIELLIGADVAGKLLTGKRRILPCGLVAVQTLLGWVLMGKVPTSHTSPSTTMTVTSLLNKDALVAELWQLDALGITDPGERKSKMEIEAASKEIFNQTITFNDERRYEVATVLQQ